MTARPCVTAPAGDEAVQNEAVRATRLSEYEMAVPGRRGPVLSTALGPGVNQRSAHVIQYVAGLSLPATAWPRQTRWASRPAPPRADQLWSGSPDGSLL